MPTFTGTNNSEGLSGTGEDDLILGLGGNDTLYGNGGSDELNGGSGDDVLYGDNNGSVGNDTLDGGEGHDWLFGGDGNDTYIVHDNNAYVFDQSGSNSGYITVDFYKATQGIVWSWAPGVQKLPYWIDALTLNSAPAYASDLASPTSIRYFFPTTVPAYLTTEQSADWKPFDAQQMQWTREFLSYISSKVNINFVEAISATEAAADPSTIVFQFSDFPALDAEGFSPSNRFGYAPTASNIWIENDGLHENFADGQKMSWIMIHEIGHTLGLKHPFSTASIPSAVQEAPYLPAADDSRVWTAMSYTPAPDEAGGVYHGVYKPLDLQALMYLYGVSPTLNSGNDTYTLSAILPNFINDGGGIDTIDGSVLSQGLSLHLDSGYWDYIGVKGSVITQQGQVTVGFGSLIENAIGGSGNDTISGNGIGNRLEGRDGGDTLEGLAGNDTLMGGSDADLLDGGDGGDTIISSTSDGNDTMSGGNGFDVLDFSAVGGVVQVNQFAGIVTGSAGNDTLTDIFEQVIGTNFADVLAGGNGVNVLDGNGGNDHLYGNGGQDLLRGGNDNDTFYGQTADGNDTIEGGAGFDLITFATAGGVIQLNMFTNSSTGTAGNDSFTGIEYVIGSNFGDVIAGNNGVNAFEGGGGADQLYGNGGIDWMRGGLGNDTATLGTGNDTWYFVNGDGVDTINDFVAGDTDDKIDLTTAATGYASFAAMQAFAGAILQSGADTFLNLDPGGGSTDRIILKNVTATNLTAADFAF